MSLRRALLLLLCCVLALEACRRPPPPAQRIAILPMACEPVLTDKDCAGFEAQVRDATAEILGPKGFVVVPLEEHGPAFASWRATPDHCTRAECFRSAATSLSARWVVRGRARQASGAISGWLKLLDGRTGEPVLVTGSVQAKTFLEGPYLFETHETLLNGLRFLYQPFLDE